MLNEKLFKAVETGNATEVEKALTEEKINAGTYYGAKSIVFAAKEGHNEILRMLLESGEKIVRASFWSRCAQPALRHAIFAENLETVKLLLEFGAGENVKNFGAMLNVIDIENITVETLRNLKKTFGFEEDIIMPKKLEEEDDIETYTESLKKLFLEVSYSGDTEKVKYYLEKLIENAVGVLTDETGRGTLEIALESSPSDIMKILANYGFHENSLRHAYDCLIINKL